MKSLKVFQSCMKILRVILILVIILMIGITIFNTLSLAVWISYDDISFVSRSDFYRAILQFTDVGTYYYNVSFFAASLGFSLINITLLIHLLILLNKEIREGSPFTTECSSLVGWVGIRFFIFPIVALSFASFIYFYFNQGFPFEFIDLSYFIYGLIFIFASFLLKHGYELEKRKDTDTEDVLNDIAD